MAGVRVGTSREAAPRSSRRSGAAAYRLRLLGGFAATRNGRAIRLPAAGRRIVALAALYRAPVPRTHAAEQLWPHLDHSSALSSLRTALSRLNRKHADLLVATPEELALAEGVSVDVHEAHALARELVAGTVPGDLVDVPLIELTRSLLPDQDDDWVVLERGHLQDVFLHALETHASRLAEAGHFVDALSTVHAALAADPVRESAAGTLIEIHLAVGNRGRALQCYREFRERLRGRIGIEPSDEMKALVEPLLTARQ